MLKKMVIVFFSLIIFIGCCDNKNVSNDQISQSEQDKIKTFLLKGIKQGRKAWELEGESADLAIETSNEIFITKPFMQFFQDSGEVKATVKADYAKVDSKTKDMHATGEVVMCSFKDKSTLYTSELFYDNTKEKFYSEAPVKIERQDSITTGLGFDATVDLATINIKKNVEIHYKEEQK